MEALLAPICPAPLSPALDTAIGAPWERISSNRLSVASHAIEDGRLNATLATVVTLCYASMGEHSQTVRTRRHNRAFTGNRG